MTDSVKTHEGWCLGSHCFFNVGPSIHATRSFEVPVTPGVKLHERHRASDGEQQEDMVPLGGIGERAPQRRADQRHQRQEAGLQPDPCGGEPYLSVVERDEQQKRCRRCVIEEVRGLLAGSSIRRLSRAGIAAHAHTRRIDDRHRAAIVVVPVLCHVFVDVFFAELASFIFSVIHALKT